jgi:hypothetical protein
MISDENSKNLARPQAGLSEKRPRPRRTAKAMAFERAQGLIQARASEIVQRALYLALDSGKSNAAILTALLKAVIPARKEESTVATNFTLETPRDAAHCQQLLAEIASAVASGRLDTDSARVATQALTAYLEARTKVEIDQRLEDVERKIAARQPQLRTVNDR